MANGRGYVRTPGDYTRVSIETDIKIPWKAYVRLGILLMIVVGGVWFLGSVVWLLVALEKHSFWYWLSRQWWKWMLRWGPLVPASLMFCWIAAAPLAIFSFGMELLARERPRFSEWDPKDGLWHPFVRQRFRWQEEDEDDYEL